MKIEHLMIKQIDEQLHDWNSVKNQSKPKKGWINLIRTTLGISSRVLAKRMGINQARVMQIEKAEINNSLTLQTLMNAAAGLNCKLVYALVPKTSLADILKEEAKKIAKNQLIRVSHSMALEAQETKQKRDDQLNNLITDLLLQHPKKLWKGIDNEK